MSFHEPMSQFFVGSPPGCLRRTPFTVGVPAFVSGGQSPDGSSIATPVAAMWANPVYENIETPAENRISLPLTVSVLLKTAPALLSQTVPPGTWLPDAGGSSSETFWGPVEARSVRRPSANCSTVGLRIRFFATSTVTKCQNLPGKRQFRRQAGQAEDLGAANLVRLGTQGADRTAAAWE